MVAEFEDAQCVAIADVQASHYKVGKASLTVSTTKKV